MKWLDKPQSNERVYLWLFYLIIYDDENLKTR